MNPRAGLRRAGVLRLGAVLLLAGCGLPAQGQTPAPQPSPTPAPTPAQGSGQEPVDPAKAGGKLLRDWLKKKDGGDKPAEEAGPDKAGSKPAEGGAEDGGKREPASRPAGPAAGAAGVGAAGQGGKQQPVDPASEAGRLFRDPPRPGNQPRRPVAPGPEAEGAGPGAGPEPGAGIGPQALDTEPAFRGILDVWYRGRWASNDDADQEANAVLTATLGDEQQDRWSGRFRGRLIADLDGKQEPNLFNGLKETWDDRVIGRVYELSVQARDLGPFETARLGRQEIIETPVPLYLDGLRLQSARLGDYRVKAEGYAGVATRIYDSSWYDAWMGGLDAEIEPWRGGRLRFDWTHVEEERDGEAKRIDDLVALSGWQVIDSDYRVEGRVSMISGRGRDLWLSGWGHQPELGLTLTLSYFELLTAQRQQVTDFDLFTTAEFVYEPYRQVRAALTKELGKDLSLDLGADIRRLADGSIEARYNREWERLFATASWSGLFDDTTSLALTFEGYDSSGEDFYTGNLDLRVRPVREVELYCGSQYSLYKFDWVTLAEKDHVRTWYLGTRYDVGADWRLRLRYEYEEDDLERYSTLRIGATWTF